MKKKKAILIVLISLVVLGILASGVFLTLRFGQPDTTRPLVLIHTPKNHDSVPVGKGLLLHAIADDPTGLERIELWVDNLLIASKVIDQTETLSKLVLSTNWVPFHSGEHHLIVRAVSTAGKTGLASIVIEAIEEEPGGWVAHVISAGETLEDAADQYGVSMQDILDLNTGLDQEGLVAGDQIYFPEALILDDGDADVDGDQTFSPEVTESGNGDADVEGDQVISPEVAETGNGDADVEGDQVILPEVPESVNGNADLDADESVEPRAQEEEIDSPSIVSSDGRSGYLRRADEMAMLPSPQDQSPAVAMSFDPVWLQLYNLLPDDSLDQLNIEVLSLETEGSYEMLHCYANLADLTPHWVPDSDNNQSTDESFSPIGSGGINWDIAQHMADENAARVDWEADQPIPFSIRCVGILGGGTESVNLGNIIDTIDPSRWGILQYAISSDCESCFSLSYKISRMAKGVDPTIPTPRNLRFSEDDNKLHWDYLPEESETISGFAILLNENLQLIELRSRRETTLPKEWINIPCGDEYRFQVVAFRNGYPDGDYSLPSNTVTIQGGEIGSADCGRTVVVTFETLTVGALGRNPRPVYGSFFANELKLSFDGKPIGGNFGSPTFGLSQNTQYTINELMEFGSSTNQLVVELPPGQAHISELLLWIGFDIYEGEHKVCSGVVSPSEERLSGTYHGSIYTDLPVGSTEDWCVVNYSIQTLGDAPVVDPGAPPPLPNLVVQNLKVGDYSERLYLEIRNLGRASWVNKAIVAQVTWPNGDLVGVYEWPNMTINPGEHLLLSHAELNPQPALGVCVLLDPDNLVEEEDDRLVAAGVLGSKNPFCRPQPDLSIANVVFNESTSQLQIDLLNQGQEPSLYSHNSGGSLESADVLFWIELPGGRPITKVFSDINMGYRDTIRLAWPISATERERMLGGYTLVVNPDHRLFEIDTTNNAFQVDRVNRVRVVWRVGYAAFCQIGRMTFFGPAWAPKNTWSMQLRVFVGDGGTNQLVLDWESPEIEIHGYDVPPGDSWCSDNYISDWIEVAGDQVLTILPTAHLTPGVLRPTRTYDGPAEFLTAADDFGGTTHVPANVSNTCLLTSVAFSSLADHAACGTYGVTCPGAGVRSLGRVLVWDEDFYREWIDHDYRICWWTMGYTIFREVE